VAAIISHCGTDILLSIYASQKYWLLYCKYARKQEMPQLGAGPNCLYQAAGFSQKKTIRFQLGRQACDDSKEQYHEQKLSRVLSQLTLQINKPRQETEET
jgi:hypothetical protein